METPSQKTNSSIFSKLNFFNSSSKLLSNDMNIFNSSNYKNNVFLQSTGQNHHHNFSFSKFMRTSSCKKPRPISFETQSNAQKKLKFSETKVKSEKENFKDVHRLNVKKSTFQISNVNFNINLCYLSESGSTNYSNYTHPLSNSVFTTAIKIKKDEESFGTTEIRKNLLSKLEENSSAKQDEKRVRKILDEKKSKMNLTKLIIDDYNLVTNEKYPAINEQLDYILNPTSNIKKEYEKVKKTNSCKCSRTNCSKFSCNCLRNGVGCDFLCACKNCENNKGSDKENSFLNHKKIRE